MQLRRLAVTNECVDQRHKAFDDARIAGTELVNDRKAPWRAWRRKQAKVMRLIAWLTVLVGVSGLFIDDLYLRSRVHELSKESAVLWNQHKKAAALAQNASPYCAIECDSQGSCTLSGSGWTLGNGIENTGAR